MWRSRWDSLRLFTPAQYDNLPGLPFPAAPDIYPGKDDVADYLQAYAAKFELPVRPYTMVTSLTRSNGVYVAAAGGRGAGGPAGGRSPPDPSRCHSSRPSPRSSTPAYASSTASSTATRQPCRPERGPGRRRRELRLPDRPGALGDPRRGTLGPPAAPRHPAAAAGPRRVVVGEHAGAGPGDGRAARKAPGRARPGDRGPGRDGSPAATASACRPAPRGPPDGR